ncbi:ABC transporter ATP-binding protein [Thioalkalivibrio sulfidiphilus]|uniref:ABC transporter ATP-binding protein n=1 Tax=Thioalkalivibrio sulfidiphilus TaxID=1033854 RepID=UPI0003815391|nr:ABC transporter ATP-binding protein [Thioalkalivibrio sulfidiphilus]
MLRTYKQLYSILDARERFLAMLVFILMFLVAVFEMVGVASIMPFMAVLTNPDVIESNKYLSAVYEFLEFESTDAFLLFLGAVFLVLIVSSLILGAISFWAQARFTQLRNHAWACRLLERYLNQPYDWFLNRHSGELGASVLHEMNKIVYGVLWPAIHMVARGLVAISLLLLMVVVDPLLAVSVAFVLGASYAGIYLMVRRYLHNIGHERFESNEQRFKVVQEALGGIKDVKVSGLESVFLERFREPSLKMARHEVAAKIVAEFPSFVMQALVFGGVMVVLIYLLASRGGFQEALPIFTLYILAGYRMLPALQQMYREISSMRFHAAVLETMIGDLRLDAIKDKVSGLADSQDNISSKLGLDKALKVANVTYSYPGSKRLALDNVSLMVPAYSRIGLVGPTGSGKTTLVDILLGLLAPSSGELTVDGHVLTPGNIRAWQRNIGYVSQHIYLADDTIAGNIAFGVPREEVDVAALEQAARVANIHDFIIKELPEGYDTLVGERGVRLSGGQKQRIGIARAIYRNPDILILDEATSALDNITEQAVMDAVNNLGRRKTVVMIAHRLSTVRECDQIIFLDHGKIVDSGTYDELLSVNPRFRQMALSAK